MRVGLLCERPDDAAFYSQVVLRILAEEGVDVSFNDLNIDTTGTHIQKRIEEKTVYFFSKPVVDLAFYFSDYDNGECSRMISEWRTKRERAGIFTSIVLCFPAPHLEGWLCLEQDAVKQLFGMDAGSELICLPEPKACIHRLIREDGDIVKIPRDYYEELGRRINLQRLAVDSAYNNMRNELRMVIARRNLNTPPNLFG